MSDTKKCGGPCGQTLPATEEYFYRRKANKTYRTAEGLSSFCRPCSRQNSIDRHIARHPYTVRADFVIRSLEAAFVERARPVFLERALCAGADPGLFYPTTSIVGGSVASRERSAWADADEARRICLVCPVRDQCLAFAIENEEPSGIWGGVPEYVRRTAWKGKTAAEMLALDQARTSTPG